MKKRIPTLNEFILNEEYNENENLINEYFSNKGKHEKPFTKDEAKLLKKEGFDSFKNGFMFDTLFVYKNENGEIVAVDNGDPDPELEPGIYKTVEEFIKSFNSN